MLSKSAKATMRLIGERCPDKGRPWFMQEGGGVYKYANGREMRGAGVYELIERGVFKPAGDALFSDQSQTFHFDPAV